MTLVQTAGFAAESMSMVVRILLIARTRPINWDFALILRTAIADHVNYL